MGDTYALKTTTVDTYINTKLISQQVRSDARSTHVLQRVPRAAGRARHCARARLRALQVQGAQAVRVAGAAVL